MKTKLLIPAAAVAGCLAMLFSSTAAAEESLRIDFSAERQSQSRVYTSESIPAWGSLRVVSGATVTLRVESGRDYELRAGGWRWTQVETVPAEVDSVQVTPEVDGDSVRLKISFYQKSRDGQRQYDSVISGPLGEWLQVLGPTPTPGRRVYGTPASPGQSPQLYVRVIDSRS